MNIRWKRCVGQDMGKGYEASVPHLDVPSSQYLYMRTTWIISKPLLLRFLWRICQGGMIDH